VWLYRNILIRKGFHGLPRYINNLGASGSRTPVVGHYNEKLRADGHALRVLKYVGGIVGFLHSAEPVEICTPIGICEVRQIEVAIIDV
jgi:hypothetical protein